MSMKDGLIFPDESQMVREVWTERSIRLPAQSCSVKVRNKPGTVNISLPAAEDCFGAFVSIGTMYADNLTSIPTVNVFKDGTSWITMTYSGRYSLMLSTGYDWVELVGYH